MAYVVVEVDARGRDYRSLLRDRLPEYLVPAVVVELEELPLNQNGKVDRRRLPEPRWTSEAEYEAPRNQMEETLADVWRDVLKVERVGVHDNFFDLGGDSISSVRVVSRVREAFDVDIQIRTLFMASTIAELAEQVESMAIDAILAARGAE